MRLDARLVELGLTQSRTLAAEAVKAGHVTVNGQRATKPAQRVGLDDEVGVAGTDPRGGYVSRAALKLVGALDRLGVDVTGKRCIDAGASTGGFTEVLLERGADEVVAIDVGTAQLDPQLREHPRVRSLEQTHILSVDPQQIGPAPIVVADLSFISLRQVMAMLAALTCDDGTLLPMVKPQFEVGKDRLGRGGVVRDERLQREAVSSVIDSAREHGMHAHAIVQSPLPGPSGNLEFFVLLRREPATAAMEALWARRCEDLNT